jgi:hypothetical protein
MAEWSRTIEPDAVEADMKADTKVKPVTFVIPRRNKARTGIRTNYRAIFIMGFSMDQYGPD